MERSTLLKLFKRILVVWAINVFTALLLIWLISENTITLGEVRFAIVFTAVLGLLNTFLWPLLIKIMLKVAVYTFGLFSLVLNGIIIMLASYLVSGINILSFWDALFIALFFAAVNMIVSYILTIDDDESYNRYIIRKRLSSGTKVKSYPGIIFLEIDGLAKPILERAFENGTMPNLKKWLDTGSHKLIEWETDLSSQTGASQAGILHGNNRDMPAFRWIEKENDNRLMTTSGPKDTPELEKRISDGMGLLANNGASRTNMFSGDARDYVFTFSKVFSKEAEVYNPIYYSYLGDPNALLRTLLLVLLDIIHEYYSRFRQWIKKVEPRLDHHHRGGLYPLIRAFTTVLIRDLTVYTVMGDIFKGDADVIYTTFMAYDEVAHHSGVDDPDAEHVLKQLDKNFGRLFKASKKAERKYKFAILSDHGQSKGKTFLQRYGYSLKDLVVNSMVTIDEKDRDIIVQEILETGEAKANAKTLLKEIGSNKEHLFGKIANKIYHLDRKKQEKKLSGEVSSGVNTEIRRSKNRFVSVLASGNLGLIYFTGWKKRLTLEEINKYFPDIIKNLINHDGIGFIMTDSTKGPVVISNNGRYYLDSDKVEGEHPLRIFGEDKIRHLKRTAGFKYLPDILVNSFYDPETNEGAAFEELIGFHGGLGGDQTRPFMFYPSEWEDPTEKIIGAENLHQIMKKWVESEQKV